MQKEQEDSIIANITEKLNNIYRGQSSKINVTVWITADDVDEDVINLYDVYNDPFELGDVLHIDIQELYPNDIKQYKAKIQANFQTEVNRKRELFGRKWIKLTSKQKYIKSNLLDKDRIEIEYFAEFTDKPKI